MIKIVTAKNEEEFINNSTDRLISYPDCTENAFLFKTLTLAHINKGLIGTVFSTSQKSLSKLILKFMTLLDINQIPYAHRKSAETITMYLNGQETTLFFMNAKNWSRIRGMKCTFIGVHVTEHVNEIEDLLLQSWFRTKEGPNPQLFTSSSLDFLNKND